MSQNLLALFKAARNWEKKFVDSKLTNSAETIDVVMSYALFILTDIHLFTHTEKTAKGKAVVSLLLQTLISAINSVK